MASALLLIGESGVGKRTFARLLAQALLCNGTDDAEKKPCGECRNCKRFLSRTHPDALFPTPLPKEKTIKIDARRGMIDTLSRHSLEGGRRVVVIENAEKMTPQAQNCLLKTLEDGAEDTYFLLTCDVESAILPTIRSRCRCVRVQPWEPERIEKALLKRGVPAERAQALSVYCEGSLGRALQMQEDASYWQARETVKRSFLSAKNTASLPGAAQALKDQKDQGDRLLDILEQEIRALMHDRVLGERGGGEKESTAWAGAPPQALRAVLEAVFAARRQRNANVGWAALSEGLMQTISEEAKKWQV
jgi:DNA polymerase-3 subunit delta'